MKKVFVILLMICLICSGCGESPGVDSGVSGEYQKISAQQAKDIMDGDDPYILLDVRTAEEFNSQHIEGAVNIPVDEIGQSISAEIPDKDTLVLVYCRSGGRSASATQEMSRMGYTNVYDFGGIINWPFDTVS